MRNVKTRWHRAMARLAMILTTAELCRVQIRDGAACEPSVIVDVHGLKCREARRLINNIINTLSVVIAVFELMVIHGYRRGHAIRDMLAEPFVNAHICMRMYDTRNRGVTWFVVAQAADAAM